jgi:hypothetical protein
MLEAQALFPETEGVSDPVEAVRMGLADLREFFLRTDGAFQTIAYLCYSFVILAFTTVGFMLTR